MFEIDYLKENIDWSKAKDYSKFLTFALVFFGFFYWLSYYVKQNSPNKDDAKLMEVQQISAEITNFPKSIKIDENTSSRSFDACVFEYFVSKANPSDIQKFYETALVNDGWIRKNDESVIFTKKDFVVHVEPDDEKGAGGKFSISICWKGNR